MWFKIQENSVNAKNTIKYRKNSYISYNLLTLQFFLLTLVHLFVDCSPQMYDML